MAFLLAPGAGAGSDSAWMQGWARRLGALGEVTPMDYTYRLEGRRAPDRLPKLIARHREAYDALASNVGARPIVLIGKSMGSRVGCHLSLDPEVKVAGCVCFGYPLVSAGKTRKVRDEVLLEMTTPVLFVQGTRDKMGPLDRFSEVTEAMRAPNNLHVVQGGDHSLLVGKRALAAANTTQDAVDAGIAAIVADFVSGLA